MESFFSEQLVHTNNQSGFLPVLSRVITPLIGVKSPVYPFTMPFIGVITAFINPWWHWSP